MSQSFPGDYGIFFQVPQTGEEAGYQENKVFYAASCYKVFLVMYVYETAVGGGIDLEEALVYTPIDRSGGTGIIQFMPYGTTFTVRQLCRLAITHSDNTAANMLRRRFGYVPYRNYATSLGCPVSGRTDGKNLTTARELGTLLRRVLQFADENSLGREVLEFMEECVHRTRIPAGIPHGVRLGNKTGDYGGFANDMALVFVEDAPYILVVLSSGAPGDGAHVRISESVYRHVSSRICTGGHCVTGVAEPGREWYFAEGYTGPGFHEWLCLQNPGDNPSLVRVEYLTQEKGALEPRIVELPARSRTTINVNSDAGEDYQLSAHLLVLRGPEIVAERPMYFRYRGDGAGEAWTGGHTVPGVPCPMREWYFAEGFTGEGFQEWVTVMNPREETAHLTFHYQTEEKGEMVVKGVEAPPRARSTFYVNEMAGKDLQLSLRLVSSRPIVAERPMYFRYRGIGEHEWTGGHCTFGSTSLARGYSFAEGTTREGFEEWLTLQNPSSETMQVRATYYFTAAEREPLIKDYRVGERRRFTVNVTAEVGTGWDVAVSLQSDMPFYAERPMYFRYTGGGAFWSGGHCVPGMKGPGAEWHFAEGCTGRGFHEWLCLLNTMDESSRVCIELFPEQGGLLACRELMVPPRSRVTLMINGLTVVPSSCSMRVRVLEGPPILAERPMYFNYGGFAAD